MKYSFRFFVMDEVFGKFLRDIYISLIQSVDFFRSKTCSFGDGSYVES